MDIRPIRTAADHRAALDEIEALFDSVPGTPEGDRLEILSVLVEAYESEHYPIPLPHPVEAIKYHMESRGLSRTDLEPFVGSRGRVSEILNKRRSLTLNMIRRLEAGLGIPAEILIQPYELECEAPESSDAVLEGSLAEWIGVVTPVGFPHHEDLWRRLSTEFHMVGSNEPVVAPVYSSAPDGRPIFQLVSLP